MRLIDKVYPGEHPGTGFNDHIHYWVKYKDNVVACEICGKRANQDARS